MMVNDHDIGRFGAHAHFGNKTRQRGEGDNIDIRRCFF
jgi:hypothetical protein